MDSLIALAFLVGVFYAIYATMSFILRKIKALVVRGRPPVRNRRYASMELSDYLDPECDSEREKLYNSILKVSKRQEIAAIQG